MRNMKMLLAFLIIGCNVHTIYTSSNYTSNWDSSTKALQCIHGVWENNTCVCNIGYEGKWCAERCKNFYGPLCKEPCNCSYGDCDSVTGRCDCHPGYIGRSCYTPCSKNKFGSDCRETCGCNGGTCNHVTGVCHRDLSKDEGEKEAEQEAPVDYFTLPAILVGVGVVGLALIAFIYFYAKRRTTSDDVNKLQRSTKMIDEDYEVPFNVGSSSNHDVKYFENYEIPCHVSKERLSAALYCVPNSYN